MTHQQGWTRWLANLVPEPVAAAPERVLINVVCVLVGLAVLISRNSSLWPQPVARAWAAAMICGGLAVIVGYWNSYRDQSRRWAGSLERVGYLAILLAGLAYGVQVIVAYGWRGLPVGAVFLGIAAAKAIRLLVSSAARDTVLRAGGPGAAR